MYTTFALMSATGTACSETALSEAAYTPSNRAYMERTATIDGAGDTPVLGTWTDVSGNEVCVAAAHPSVRHLQVDDSDRFTDTILGPGGDDNADEIAAYLGE